MFINHMLVLGSTIVLTLPNGQFFTLCSLQSCLTNKLSKKLVSSSLVCSLAV